MSLPRGGDYTAVVSCSSTWTLSGGADWCSPSPASGGSGAEVKFHIKENPDPDERRAVWSFKCEDKTATLSVVQKQADALTVTSSRFEVGADGGVIEVEVIANVDFSYEIPEESASWIAPSATKALQSHTLLFEVSPNGDTDRREGQIIISSGDISETIHVYLYQAGTEPVLVLTQSEYTVSDQGETIKVEIAGNVDYSVKMPDADWITEVSTKAVSSYTHYYQISANETYDSRSAQIIFSTTDGSLQQSVNIIQVQKDAIILSETIYEIGNEGGQIDIELLHNVQYTTSSSDWIHPLPATKGLTESTASFSVDANTGYEGRTGFISFTDGTIEQTLTVLQGQSDAMVLPRKEFTADAMGGTVDVTVRANTPYSFIIQEEEQNWVSAQPQTRAMSEDIVSFNVSENTTYGERSAEIYFFTEDRAIKDTVLIIQRQNDAVIVARDEYRIESAGGQFQVETEHNVEYLPETRALETSVLTFQADANDTGAERTDFIVLTAPGIECSIKVVQEADKVLLLSEHEAEVPSDGGSVSLHVESNVEYTVTVAEQAREWIGYTSSATDVQGVTEYAFSVSENQDSEPRSAEIIFGSTDGTLREAFIITQLQKDVIIVSRDEYHIESAGGQFQVDLPETRALETSVLTFQADANDTGAERTDFIVLTAPGIECSIKVVQAADKVLRLSEHEAEVPADGGSVSLQVESNIEYTVTVAEQAREWIGYTSSATDVQGVTEYTFSVSETQDSEPRSAEIIFGSTDGALRETFIITQLQKDMLSLGETSFEIGYAGGKISTEVYTNVEYTVTIDSDGQSWIAMDDTGTPSLLSFSVSENPEFTYRSTLIKVESTDGAHGESIYVKQTGKPLTLSVSETSITMPSVKSETEIAIETNGTYWRATSDQTSWCRVSPSSGTSSGPLTIKTVSDNTVYEPRTATVTVRAQANGDDGQLFETRTVTVIQEAAAFLNLSTENIETEAEASVHHVEISSNAVWTVSSDASWCTVSPSSGQQNGTLTLSLSRNDTDDVRTATVTVTAGTADNPLTRTITVKQYPPNNFDIGDWEQGSGDQGGNAE